MAESNATADEQVRTHLLDLQDRMRLIEATLAHHKLYSAPRPTSENEISPKFSEPTPSPTNTDLHRGRL